MFPRQICKIAVVLATSTWLASPARAATLGLYDLVPNTQFADVNGDGKADAIVVTTNGVVVRESTGSSFSTAESDWTGGAFSGTHGTFFADVNGDGKADAIAVNANGIFVRLSNGSSFNATTAWTTDAFYGNETNTFETYFADVNGDGKADAIVVNSTGIYVRGSTGSSFYPAFTNWTGKPFYGTRGTFFADINGDHSVDAIAVNDNGVFVRFSNGSSFPEPAINESGNAFYGDANIVFNTYFADVNADGKADAIAVNTNGIFVRGMYVSGFATAFTNWTGGAYYSLLQGTFFADVTGDGRADVLVVNADGIHVRASTGDSYGPDSNWTGNPYYGNVDSCSNGVTYTTANGCTAPATCGGQGEACCMSGTVCASGLTCRSTVCSAPAACGNSGQSCCSGSACYSGLSCQNNVCVNSCSVSTFITVTECYNIDGTLSDYYTPDSVTDWGCGVSQDAAENGAATELASVGYSCLTQTPVAGCCTYSEQVVSGCECN